MTDTTVAVPVAPVPANPATPAPVTAPAAPGGAATPVPPKKTWTQFLACVWTATSDLLQGLKTILFFGITASLGLAQELGNIDLTPLFSMVLPEGSKITVAQAVVLMSVAGVMLRLVTKTKVFNSMRKQFGSAPVDDPTEATK